MADVTEKHGDGGGSRIKLLGIPLNVVSQSELVEAIRLATARDENTLIAYCNLHGAYLYHRDASLAELFARADLVYIDGMPLAWWGRLMGLAVSQRVTFLDYSDEFFRAGDALGWRIFYLGGKPGVARRAAEKLTQRYKNIRFDCRDGYFDLERKNNDVIRDITAFNPDIVLLGMGMPRQEHWLLKTSYRFKGVTFIAIGAAFDYIAGETPTPPRWLGPAGLEWTYRLASEPKRLAKRYLIEPWFLLPCAVRDLVTYRLAPAAARFFSGNSGKKMAGQPGDGPPSGAR